MASNANQIAFKALFKLGIFITALLFIRSWVADFHFPTPSARVPQAQVRQNTATLYTSIAPTPAPVMPTPPALPRRFTFKIVPGRWSKPIELPEGATAYVTFKLGRIRIEQNGVDLGICYRQPLFEGAANGQTLFHPFSVLDKRPRTISFGSDTRTLRFASGESEAGQIWVEFR